jgi:8-oxo-dGTP pyrophosphatase MutT (NUDIX family)
MNKTLKRYISEVIQSSDYGETYRTAQRVHRDQRRRSGEPYFDHPKEVRNIARRFYPEDKIAQLAALLHDALEDYPKGGVYETEEEVLEAITGSIIDSKTSKEVIRVVRSLTHDKNIDYTDYVLSLSGTSLRVKLTDMLHNLMTSPSEKQKRKYGTALMALQDRHDGAPPEISRAHMNQLLSLANIDVDESKIRESIRIILKEGPQSAGVIIVDTSREKPLFLALKTDNGFDIPKGQLALSDGGDHFSAAKREVEEEASLTSLDFLWGMDHFDTPKTRCWIAQTDQVPKIKPNPETGEKEHKGFEWVDYNDMKNNCHGHLQGAINWANKLVSGEKK